MLEVVHWDPDKCEAVVMSGFGPNANWRLNVLADGATQVQIAGLRFEPLVRSLEPVEAAAAVARYEQRSRLIRHIVRGVLSRLAGFRYDGSPEARERLVEALPLLAFSPKSEGDGP